MDLDDDDIAWVKAHAAAVNETFGREFEAARDRFKKVRYYSAALMRQSNRF